MVVADTKAADSGGLEKRKKEEVTAKFCLCQVPPWYKPYKPQTHPPYSIKKVN
jgi:hypothetical protein